GSCGVDFSQDEMIVALNEAQQGEQRGPDSQCFKKIRVSVKGDPLNSVVVRVVDTCPHRYCSYGQLDLSQAAFKKFAPMSKGVLDLEWSF
ncbi:RlpA-like double-psi beta-barrel-protein domain-containing protein-containing protein, partial [Linnemannia elongata]